ncbi:hypothetical protein GCM10007063_34350 [Lentibacillus kapialis]|uniref:DUF4030 domain-containing protein n=1 Tax=Lentibacillus kapialis TaxID=340214 RepID=A0A917Q360_9BACI|nr:hypothetical protein [Lentibacillus kapialis]GGK09056.1 hypothetical protein GCM10007063_34350 [Lentibacillus kapialis]
MINIKKVVIGLVSIIIIFGAAFVFAINSEESANAESDEQIEDELVKSMNETKQEKAKIEEIFRRSSNELKDKEYGEVGLSYSHKERILTAQVKDKGFLEANKSKIRNIITDTAKEVGFKDFDIKFRISESTVTRNKEEKKLRESIDKVSNIVSDVLEDKGHNLGYSILVEPKKKIIIEGTDKNFAGNGELEKRITNAILSKTNMKYTVKLKKKSEREIKNQEWHPIFAAIREETNKKFNEYRGFASSFHPQPLQIIIKTKINNSWFGNSDEKVKQIEYYVDKIIELKREELSIEEIPYDIIIRDKNNKKIN